MRWALVLLGGAALTFWAFRITTTPLEPACARALAATLHVDASRVSVGRAQPTWSGAFLEDVRVDGVRIYNADISLDLVEILLRRTRPERARLVLRGVEARLHDLPISVWEVAIEIDRGKPKRAAFVGGCVGPFGGLTGSAVDEGGAIALRVARPGLTATGRLEGKALTLDAVLERLPLSGVELRGLVFDGARASGALAIKATRDRIHAQGSLAVDELGVDHASIAPRRLEHLKPRFEGELYYSAGALATSGLRAQLGGLTLNLAGQVDPARGFDLTVELDEVACAEALRSLPRALVPTLDGMTLDGALRGRAHSAGTLGEQTRVAALDVDLGVGCRVGAEPPLADVARTFALGPAHPSWRPLDQISPAVRRAFVVAEDGRFFRHHGFDLPRIRQALEHDLSRVRIARGASTITQQTAKNLFLSGERTLGRKLEEAVLAWRLEERLGKRRILELYLNVVEMGPGVHGVAEAAERYFGKEPDQLTLDEAAQLAALLPAPARGMDGAWRERYLSLKKRLPSDMKLSQR